MKKFKSKEEIENYLLSQPIQQIVSQLVEEIWGKQEYKNSKNVTQKIVVSEEQYSDILNLFKVRGKTENGEEETRGRKKVIKDNFPESN